MPDRRPNRWQAARDAHLAGLRTQTSAAATSRAGWSFPVTRALRWLVVLVLVLVAYAWGPALVDALVVWWLS